MIALLDTYDIERDRNHERKAKMRAERRNLKLCDRINGLGKVKRLSIVKKISGAKTAPFLSAMNARVAS